MFVCVDLGYVCRAIAIVDLLSLYLTFLCFGLLLRTRSRPYGLCHHSYTLTYIKGFGSPILHVYTCLLLCFVLVLASLICATHWLYMHFYTFAYTSMHKSCLLVCRPCFNTMKLWTSDPNRHLSLADTTFCLLSSLLVCCLAC